MPGIGGLKLWMLVELSFDQYGNATITRSFIKPSKDSTIKGRENRKGSRYKPKQSGVEETLWE